MKKFALIGAAGFVAPRHLEAIKNVGGELVAAFDPCDSVGVLDRYFPKADFFKEEGQFVDFLKSSPQRVDYVSICSPNYLHEKHVRLALRSGCDAICEKPLVVARGELEALQKLELESEGRVFPVLQLRFLPQIIALKKWTENGGRGTRAKVNLRYITRRGPWYRVSWKGCEEKSGGLAMNIGIHFFDLLLWLFGPARAVTLREKSPVTWSGELKLRGADVEWELSIDESRLPRKSDADPVYRILQVNGEDLDLSSRFSSMHTEVYRHALFGDGFGIEDTRPAIDLVQRLRGLAAPFALDLSTAPCERAPS